MKRKANKITRITALFFMFFGVTAAVHGQCSAVIGTSIFPVAGCEILTVQFSDNSPGVVNRSWDFGDGSESSNAQNPAHSFHAGQGDTTYIVTLTIECTSGETDIAQEIVTVYAKPAIDFLQEKSSICAITDSVCMSNLSPFEPGNNYLWNFGDGTISENYEPCKVYSTPGTYDLDLTVTNEHGCVNSKLKENFIEVIPVPNTAFTVSDVTGCHPFTIHLTNITDTVGTGYSGWNWNFDDGSPEGNTFNPSAHTFLYPGKYRVKLGTTNSLGCSNFSTQTITVNPSPEADFSVESPACWNKEAPVEFTGSASDSALFEWVFTDAIPDAETGPGPFMLSWLTPGIKKIDLRVSDLNCTATASKKVVVNPLSGVNLAIEDGNDTICQGQEVIFISSPDNYPNYEFYLNNVLVQSSHHNTYSGTEFQSGDRIHVQVTDHLGCTQLVSDTIELTVLTKPVLNLVSSAPSDSICAGDGILFTLSPAGLDQYNFYSGNILLQSGQADNFYTSGLDQSSVIFGTAVQGDCLSAASNSIQTHVGEALPAPVVNCGNTTDSSIVFVWDSLEGALGYEISLNGGAFQDPGTGPGGLSHTLTALNPGDSYSLEVRAIGEKTCNPGLVSVQRTCLAQDCDSITFDLLEQDLTVCEGEQVNLGIKNISTTSYSVRWNSGLPVNDTLFSFPAESSGIIGISLLDSTQLHCAPIQAGIRLHVIELPELRIQSLEGDEICEGSPLNLSVQPGDYENYKFFENTLIVQDGPRNSFTTGQAVDGHYYFAIAAKGSCIAASDSLRISVKKALIQPLARLASSDPSSATFTWDPVPGADVYLVSMKDGPFIQPSSGQAGLSHIVQGLIPGEAVSLSVIARGDQQCQDSEASLPAIGFAESCTGISYSMTNQYQVCEGDSILLDIRDINLDSYTVTWGGTIASRSNTHMIHATHDTIILVHIQDLDSPLCPGVMDMIRISVSEIPEKLSLASPYTADTICEQDLVIFNAEPAGYDSYEFYDGFRLLQAGTSNRIETSSWIDGHSLSVLARDGGCAGDRSDPEVIHVKSRLRSPQVNCGSSTDSTLSFRWDPIPGAEGYLVSLDGDSYQLPSTGTAGLSHELVGLNPGEIRSLTVMATGQEPCSISLISDTTQCIARECELIDFQLSPYDTICEGETLELSTSGFSTADYSLSWDQGAHTADTTFLLQGINDSRLWVSMTDLGQPACPPARKYFEIKVHELPRVSLSSSSAKDTICEGEVLEITASPAGWDNYIFRTGNAVALQESAYHILETDTLSKTLMLYVESVNLGCHTTSDTLITHVTDLPDLGLTASSTGEICYGDEIVFTASPGYDRYLFRDNNKILATTDQNAATISVRSEFVTLEAYRENECSVRSKDTLWFNISPLPEAQLTMAADTLCLDEPVGIMVTPSGFTAYEFYLNDSLIQGGSSNLLTTGFRQSTDEVSVLVTDDVGCQSYAGNRVSPFVKPSPKNRILSAAGGICVGSSLELEAALDPSISTGTFYWNTGSRDTILSVSPQTSTSYYLVSIAEGCTRISDSIFVEVDQELPTAYAGEDVTICITDSLQLEGKGGLNYHWTPDSLVSDPFIPDSYARAGETTKFVLTATNAWCSDTDTMVLYIDRCLEDLTAPVPQIITPNGDGANDTWIIEDVDYFPGSSVEIYNRWGSQVFISSPYDNSWGGTANDGQDLPQGTYYYVINLGNGTASRAGYIIIHR